jgi:hypothetical protein
VWSYTCAHAAQQQAPHCIASCSTHPTKRWPHVWWGTCASTQTAAQVTALSGLGCIIQLPTLEGGSAHSTHSWSLAAHDAQRCMLLLLLLQGCCECTESCSKRTSRQWFSHNVWFMFRVQFVL